jgi:hypothetical protein
MSALDLAQRAVACKGWRWMPGMLATARDGKAWRLWSARGSGRAVLPYLEDPATLGCLLALVREAWGVPTLTTNYVDHMDQVAWAVDDTKGRPMGYGATEAEALVAALEAAP